MSRTPQDEPLRGAFAGADASPREGCPDADRVWAAVTGEAPAHETRALVDHTATCGSCAEAWRLAVALRAPAAAAAVAAPRARARRLLLPAAALAAAVVAVFFVLPRFDAPAPPAPSPYRADPRPAVRSEIEDGASLGRDAFTLRWSAGPPGTTWHVRVASADLTVLDEALGLVEPAYTVPIRVLEDVESGERILWRVTASLPDGTIARSPTFVATVR